MEAKGVYAELLEKKSPEEAFQTILAGTREHTRVLLPWNDCVKEYPQELKQEPDADVFGAYKTLIELRKTEPALVYGKFTVLNKEKNRFVYRRSLNGVEYIVDCNLSDSKKKAYQSRGEYELVFATKEADPKVMMPYEARIWRRKTNETN